jgi:protein-S-isoprenylcysteine O-methyltransferase Ste14
VATLRRSVIVSILFTIFGGPGIILIYLPFAITRFCIPIDSSSQPTWQRVLAVTLIAVGLIPLLESITRFVRIGRGTLMPNVPTERLVVTGLYRYVRNPMYVGDMTVLSGEALLFRSPWLALYAAFVWLILDQFIRRYEEPTLIHRHGAEYLRYREQVPRWRPHLRPRN